MRLITFDDGHFANFLPLTFTRSVGDLRCGILKLRQRLESIFGNSESTCIIINTYLEELYTERHPDWIVNRKHPQTGLYINSRVVINEDSIKAIKSLKPRQVLYNGNDLVAGVFCSDDVDLFQKNCQPIISNMIEIIPTDIGLYQSNADLIHDNARMLVWDFEHYFYDKDNYFDTELGVTVLHPYNIWIAEGVKLSPGVILDASEGPIVLDEDVKIMPNAVLCGPLYIGKKSIVKIGAKIYGNTSIGPVCKVGGEIEGSIIQAYSNKQHDGFLGHAYVGEWVNIGADTNNSDLKNTYKNVAYYSYPQRAKVTSSTPFLGCVIGDHSKIGINCSINTGAVIGIGCNLWGSDLITDFIPDFSWGEADNLTPYRISAFYETASIVKQRRLLELSETERVLFNQICKGDLSARFYRS